MKIEYPSNLIEFILAGVLVEASILALTPDLLSTNSFIFGLIIISAAYVLGLGINSISTLYFSYLFEEWIKKRKISSNKAYAELSGDIIKSKLGLEVNDDFKNMSQIHSLLHNYLTTKSEYYTTTHNYQMRLYRMSRTAVFIAIYWLVFLFITAYGVIPNNVFLTLKQSNPSIFWYLVGLLIVLIICLHLATFLRISYIAGNAFSHFTSIQSFETPKE